MKPTTRLHRIYRQLRPWKLFVILSRGEIRELRDELDRAYPSLQSTTPTAGPVVSVLTVVLWIMVIVACFGALLALVVVLAILMLGGML